MSARIVYATGRPYGAPVLHVRGGATRLPEVREWIKAHGGRWDGQAHAWKWYAYNDEASVILSDLRDTFGVTVDPKDGMDPAHIVPLREAVA